MSHYIAVDSQGLLGPAGQAHDFPSDAKAQQDTGNEAVQVFDNLLKLESPIPPREQLVGLGYLSDEQIQTILDGNPLCDIGVATQAAPVPEPVAAADHPVASAATVASVTPEATANTDPSTNIALVMTAQQYEASGLKPAPTPPPEPVPTGPVTPEALPPGGASSGSTKVSADHIARISWLVRELERVPGATWVIDELHRFFH